MRENTSRHPQRLHLDTVIPMAGLVLATVFVQCPICDGARSLSQPAVYCRAGGQHDADCRRYPDPGVLLIGTSERERTEQRAA